MPFLKTLLPQTHTDPGFRLGPDLPKQHTSIGDRQRVRVNPFNGALQLLINRYG